MYFSLIVTLVGSAAALSPSAGASRRAVLGGAGASAMAGLQQPAFAELFEIGDAGKSTKQVAQEEMAAIGSARKEAMRIAALPISKLRVAREHLDDASTYLEQNKWYELRGEFSSGDLGNVRGLMTDVAPTLKAERAKVLAEIGVVDAFAYKRQMYFLKSSATIGEFGVEFAWACD